MPSKLTQAEFVAQAKAAHGDCYDYSQSVYVRSRDKVIIICREHGAFDQTANSHLVGKGCPHCGDTKITKEDFITVCNKVHEFKYDYSLTEYINDRTHIRVVCPVHGEYVTPAGHHKSGKGCSKCYHERRTLSTLDFVARATSQHKGFYDYSLTEYTGSNSQLAIICPKHGPFRQLAYSHLQGKGCQKCKNSRGEDCVISWLEENTIPYIHQANLPGTRLKFDFLTRRGYIEYQGAQHYRPVKGWGGASTFERVKARDSLKRRYCRDNGIPLLLIGFWQDPATRLSEFFGI